MNSLLVKQEASKSSETRTEIQRKTGPLYINVRTPHEFETVHIEGAVNFPLQDLSSRMDELHNNVRLLSSAEHKIVPSKLVQFLPIMA